MTRAPPDFPFPLDVIANRTLKQFEPKGVPDCGFLANDSNRAEISFLMEGYLFARFLSSFSKGGVGTILKLIEQFANRLGLHFTFFIIVYVFN